MLAEATHWRHFHRNYLSVKRLWRRPSIKPGEDFLKQFVIQVWFKTVDPLVLRVQQLSTSKKRNSCVHWYPLFESQRYFAKFPVFNLGIAASWLLRKRSDLCGAFGCTSRLLGGFSLVLSAFHPWCTSPRDWNPISTAVWELIFICDGQTS